MVNGYTGAAGIPGFCSRQIGMYECVSCGKEKTQLAMTFKLALEMFVLLCHL